MTETILEVRDLDAGYGENEVLKQIRFLITEHQFIGIIGPNGSGKSTLMQVLARSLSHTTGVVLFRGDELDTLSYREFGRGVGFVPQESGIPFAYSVFDIVMMGRNPHIPRFRQPSPRDHEIVHQALEQTGTLDFADRSITSLSGGEKQRVLIARILAQDPELLLLDEPFAHIDLHHQHELIQLIRDTTKGRRAVIGVFHDINLAASYCNHLIVLHEGVIRASGAPREILQEPLLREIFQISMVIGENPITGTPHLYVTESIPEGTKDNKHIILISGGGTGAPLISMLAMAGYRLNCGVLSENDADCRVARRYGIEFISEPPFSKISVEHEQMLFEQVSQADWVVVTAMPVGWGNYPNIGILKNIPAQKIILLLPLSDPIIADFTGGAATKLLNQLLNAGAKRAFNISDIFEILEHGR
ncbi:MAG TPA: ABC transporter ATP-binding protein [Methanospirillum sp.]|nr:ABC transporter ATP-binding protein [Methanospirillum sp.]